MIYCQRCLHELPDGTIFCDVCGTSLLPASPIPMVDVPAPHRPGPGASLPPPAYLPEPVHTPSPPQLRAPPAGSVYTPTPAHGPAASPVVDLTPSTPPRTIPRVQVDGRA